MSETKFTKGKWVAYVRGCYLNQGYSSVEAEGKRIYGETMYNTSEAEDTANAHLIAAAPEMYGLLERINQGNIDYIENGKAFEDIELLLAKARGES